MLLLNLLNSVTKKIKIEKKDCGVGTQDLPCKRQRLYHSATEPQATEQILILNLIHASVISQILWIPWIHWIQRKFCSIWRKLQCTWMWMCLSLVCYMPASMLPFPCPVTVAVWKRKNNGWDGNSRKMVTTARIGFTSKILVAIYNLVTAW